MSYHNGGGVSPSIQMHTKLPIELFEGIICHITSAPDLYKLLLVSRALHDEAERFLYRDISVNELRYLALADTLRIPRIARLVYRLEVVPSSHYRRSVDITCLTSLHINLPHLISLKHFILQGTLSFDKGDKHTYLLENVSNSLESLIFDSIDQEHVPLLEKQTRLTQLIMHQPGTKWNFSAFPNLVVAGCPAELFNKCLPYLNSSQSKIRRLRCTQSMPEKDAPPFHSIRVLDLFLFNNDLHVLAKIVCKFPNLEYLKCTVEPDDFLVSGYALRPFLND